MEYYVLKEITRCRPDQQKALLQIRNEPLIRAAMYHDHIISEAEHHAWLQALAGDERRRIFLLLNSQGQPEGMAGLSALEPVHKRADWAFYITSERRGGLGSLLEYTMLAYVFETCALEKLNCEVLESNLRVVAMHKKFGFQEEGFRRQHIQREGQGIGAYLLGMTRAEWLAAKEALADALAARQKLFSIAFDAL